MFAKNVKVFDGFLKQVQQLNAKYTFAKKSKSDKKS